MSFPTMPQSNNQDLRSFAQDACAGAEIIGPLNGLNEQSSLLGDIVQFRQRMYSSKASYLLHPAQLAIETALQLDYRSIHFLALNSQSRQLVGTLRITPSPFEFSALSSELREIEQEFASYVEFSRFIVNQQDARPGLSLQLMAKGTLWALDSGSRGIVALCRRGPHRLFARFGLSPYRDRKFCIPSRGAYSYDLLSASFNDIQRKIIRQTSTASPRHSVPAHHRDPDNQESM